MDVTGSLVIIFCLESKKSSSCCSLDEGSARYRVRNEPCCWPAFSLCYGLCIHFHGLTMAVCDTERDIRRLCDLFSSWYAALAPVVIIGYDMILTWILGFDDLFLFTNSVWISQNCSRTEAFSRSCAVCMHSFAYFSVVYLDQDIARHSMELIKPNCNPSLDKSTLQ